MPPSSDMPATLSAHSFRILVQVVNHDPSADLATIAASSSECVALLRLADHHGVGMLLRERLLQDHGSDLRPPLRESVSADLRDNAARNLAFLQTFGAIQQMFAPANIKVLPLKGAALAQILYGNLGLRPCRDLDVLVAEGDVLRAEEVLRSNGYSPVSKFSRAQKRALIRNNSEYQFWENAGELLVELQWQLLPRYFSVKLTGSEVLRAATVKNVAGVPCLVPTAEHQLWIVLLNGAKEGWQRLLTVCDIERALRNPELDWAVVAARARERGMMRLLLVGLGTAERLLGCALPAAIRDLLASDRMAQGLVAEASQRVEASAAVVGRAFDGFWLRGRERWRDRALFLLRSFVTPGSAEWETVSLPDWLYVLYFPVRFFRVAGLLLFPGSRRSSS